MTSTTEPRSNAGADRAAGSQRLITFSHGSIENRHFLDAYEIPGQDFTVTAQPDQQNNSQRCVLTDMGGGAFTIMQASSGRYLDAHEIEGLDFRAVTRPRQDNDTRLWRLLRSGTTVRLRQVSSGRIFEVGNDAVQARNLTLGVPDAGSATGTPAVHCSPGTNTHQVAYRSGAAHIHEIRWTFRGERAHTYLTEWAAAPPAADLRIAAVHRRRSQRPARGLPGKR